MPAPYIFDPSGLLPNNKIQNEPRNVLGLSGSNAYLIIPDLAPFFAESLTVVNVETGQTLIENVHYFLSHHWQQASQTTGKDVYGTITLIGVSTPNGAYMLNYQTIGGAYISYRPPAILEAILANAGTYVNVDWNTIPVSFPGTPHVEDLSGASGVIPIYQAMTQIASALRAPTHGVSYDDLRGADAQYASGVVTPFLSMVSSINSFMSHFGETVLKSAFDANVLNDINFAYDLNHYTFKIGKFICKIGKYYFTPGSELKRITFVGDPFEHLTLMTYLHTSMQEGNVAQDKTYWNNPDKDGVGVNFDLDVNFDTQTRVVRYFAIGF